MILTLQNAIVQLSSTMVIVQSHIYTDKHQKNWRIERNIYIKLTTGRVILIPQGYVYDMATVPKWLWSFIRPYNKGLLAYLLHDFLYTNQKSHRLNRYQSDKEWLTWINTINPKNKFDNNFRYFFIRLFGWMWWYNFV